MRARSFAAVLLAATACAGAPAEPTCPSSAGPSATPPNAAVAQPAPAPPPSVDEARAFVAGVEDDLRRLWVARDQAAWVNQTDITEDTEALSAAAEEATAAYVGAAVARARRFDPIRGQLPPDVARKLYLLATSQTVPAPSDPAKRRELAATESWMTSAFGKGQYCPPDGSPLLKYREARKGEKPEPCLHLDELSKVLAKSRRFDELVEAWRGWHATAAPMKGKYARYVELANEGAREIGFEDMGALWRSRFDMSPAELRADVERLWGEVRPLYEALHCWVRSRLQARYGKDRVPDHAPIPAHLLGNMWAQEWSDVYDLVAPYPRAPSLDVGRKLVAGKWDATRMVRQGERFFTGLGFDALPPTFWTRSQLVRPRDREVVCHASAWDVTWSGDLRVKMCIEPTEEDFVTIHHELGHDFYYQRYVSLPILFQAGANDGFHEAVGDTMALSVTPAYLASVGLLDAAPRSDEGRIDALMKTALDKVAFLPFGLLVDAWRWDTLSGRVKADDYETAWWALARELQGISPPVARTADDFDPGSKYHVAASTPYLPYFLARIYQFQFHKALCQAAGYIGPLDQCSIHDDKRAGAKLIAMLALGASKPWPDAMEAIGAGRKADAGPMLEYFAPLSRWLEEHDKGLACGW